MKRLKNLRLPKLAGFVASLSTVTLAGSASAGTPPRGPSFDNDIYDDAAIGAHTDNMEGILDATYAGVSAGGVDILYGSYDGPSAPQSRPLHLEPHASPDSGAPSAGESFGETLAWGDFNNDCFDDLVVGMPEDSVDGHYGAGSVRIYWGGEDGLTTSQFPQVLYGGSSGSGVQNAQSYDRFGKALAAGDFDGDGIDDLAIGIPFADSDGALNSGAIMVFRGVDAPLMGNQDLINPDVYDLFTQDSPGMAGDQGQPNDYFGAVLTAGDYNCDGVDDLAVGTPDEDDEDAQLSAAGGVRVLYGRGSRVSRTPGLSTLNSQFFSQEGPVAGAYEAGDRFGAALASGDFDGNGCADLVASAPSEYARGARIGVVHVLYGSSGTTAFDPAAPNGDELIMWDYQGFTPSKMQWLGDSLAVGRFNNDHYDDLAIGAPRSHHEGVSGPGRVFVLPGDATGIAAHEFQAYDQRDTASGTLEAVDRFGQSMAYGRYSGEDKQASLLVGAYGESNFTGHVGQIEFLSGGPLLITNPMFEWFQGDVQATTGTWDQFGYASLSSRPKARCEPNPTDFPPPTDNPSCDGYYWYDLCDAASPVGTDLLPMFCQGIWIDRDSGNETKNYCSEAASNLPHQTPAKGIFLGCYTLDEITLYSGQADPWSLAEAPQDSLLVSACSSILQQCKPEDLDVVLSNESLSLSGPWAHGGVDSTSFGLGPDGLPTSCCDTAKLPCSEAQWVPNVMP